MWYQSSHLEGLWLRPLVPNRGFASGPPTRAPWPFAPQCPSPQWERVQFNFIFVYSLYAFKFLLRACFDLLQYKETVHMYIYTRVRLSKSTLNMVQCVLVLKLVFNLIHKYCHQTILWYQKYAFIIIFFRCI